MKQQIHSFIAGGMPLGPLQVPVILKRPKTDLMVLPEGDNSYLQTKLVGTMTPKIYDLTNSTVPINGEKSAGWLEWSAGVTNVAVGVYSYTLVGTQADGIAAALAGTAPTSQAVLKEVSLGRAHLVPSSYLSWSPETNVGITGFWQPSSVDATQFQTAIEQIDVTAVLDVLVARDKELTLQLNRLQKMTAGWDGEEAPTVSEKTGKTAASIIRLIFEASLAAIAIPKCRLGPLTDGSLRFECTHGNKELFITVSDDAVEVQAWQPRSTLKSVGYWETDLKGAKGHVGWLLA
jgi:hypothetical protein